MKNEAWTDKKDEVDDDKKSLAADGDAGWCGTARTD